VNPYEALGLQRGATLDAVKQAYRRLSFANHPDRNPGDTAAEERFKNVTSAYEILSDPSRRAAYDEFGARSFVRGFDAAAERARNCESFRPASWPTYNGGPGRATRWDGSFADDVFRGNWANKQAFAFDHRVDVELPLRSVLGGGIITARVWLNGEPVDVAFPVQVGARPGDTWTAPAWLGHKAIVILFTLRQIIPDPNWRIVGADIIGKIKVTLPLLLTGGQVVVDAPRGPLVVHVPAKSLASLRVVGHGLHGGSLILEPDVVWPTAAPELLAELRRHTPLS
jgi:curved DNA-binding protein